MSKEQEIISAFSKAYPEETVMIYMHEDMENEVIEMWCCSMAKYKCTYNGGNVQIEYIGGI